MDRTFIWAVAACLLVSLLGAGCDGRGARTSRSAAAQAKPAAPDPVWTNVLSAHTSGLVSRQAKIHIVFNSDVVGADAIGSSADRLLSTDPRVPGSASFVSRREIVFAPEREFAPGQRVLLRLSPAGLTGVPAGLSPYEFAIDVQKPAFDVTTFGLTTLPGDEVQMQLQGALSTSDFEAADKIEKVLAATYAGQPVPIVWNHASAARRHDFTISKLTRGTAASRLVLRWDGKPIGSESSGETTIEVPAGDRFAVTQLQLVDSAREGERHFAVHFSSTLDRGQDLKGLVRLSQGEHTSRIEGNVLKIFPAGEISGDITVTVEAGIKSRNGTQLDAPYREIVAVAGSKPQVRFAGKGVILPDNPVLSVPFEAVNARSVRVTAFRIYADNLPQFLQVNALGGQAELGRVGRYLWRKTIQLNSPVPNRWNRFELDVSELMRAHPGGLIQLSLNIGRADSAYECPGAESEVAKPEANLEDLNDSESVHASFWDGVEEYYDYDYEGRDGSEWQHRDDPCRGAYFRYASGIRDSRNFLASNIGLLAKRDSRGAMLVAATDLRVSTPLANVKITAFNFQLQALGSATTDGEGIARLAAEVKPFVLLAEHGDDRSYLKLSPGLALPVSHFDVGGLTVTKAIKGYLYGERGVWRPGDELHLTFVLQDAAKTLPADHPVTLELFNPRGQLTQSLTNNQPVGGFYAFKLTTPEDAPTGNWRARATLGGATFEKTLKIEAIMPNRLRVDLDLGDGKLDAARPIEGKLSSQWLSGASAAGLRATVELRLARAPTQFARHKDYVFDDPAREPGTEPEIVFDGELDSKGEASIRKQLESTRAAPGMLNAAFMTRVFERGGAFSVSRTTVSVSPFARYVGLRLPKAASSYGMLPADQAHTLEIASVDAEGKPRDGEPIEITLYKVEWKWWWDRSGESLAQFVSSTNTRPLRQETIKTRAGAARWQFDIKDQEWGRYLVRACDTEGEHCAGAIFYMDWPYYAGREREQAGPAATMLSLTADKEQYSVGETARVRLPAATSGRALVTVESSTGILQTRWIEPQPKATHFDLPIDRSMAPNVYLGVTLIQPHAGRDNDRPIRLYGVLPIKVVDPQTRLAPVLTAPEEWAPETKVSIDVAEASGREMAYTVAIVDEGLLGLTNFVTPNLHEHFYQREALGVSTWDLFDDVVGAYASQLERLLALGGGDSGPAVNPDQGKRRFPPLVRFLGPFKLAAGGRNKHEVALPAYVGAVRAMIVAGDGSAYGSADKSVYVRRPLMLLPTLPRVVGPGEEIAVPVSVFMSDSGVKDVALKIEPSPLFTVVSEPAVRVPFAQPGEQLGMLRIRTGERLGKARVAFTASGGRHRAAAEIFLDVRASNPPVTRHLHRVLEPGETWTPKLADFALPGTGSARLEMSAVPSLNLERRLDYLIHYPYGCIEQTTSSAFPQLYLPALVKLEKNRALEVTRNVNATISRLRTFQVANGAFTYWPGVASADFDLRAAWSTNYVGHFLVEAARLGYEVPASMSTDWSRYQRSAAQAWRPPVGEQRASSVLDQAYRLYVLALARQPEMGAMNRLRELPQLSGTERWLLAAAYHRAGIEAAAGELLRDAALTVRDYRQPDAIFGSELRDRAILLDTLVTLGRVERAKPLIDSISADLSSDGWHSTQEIAYSLMAMARFVGRTTPGPFTFEQRLGGRSEKVSASTPIHTAALAGLEAGGSFVVKNTHSARLFATVVQRGVPLEAEAKAAASGLAIDLRYEGLPGGAATIERVPQGTDLVARIAVKNTGATTLDNLALTHMVPAGWEINNERLDDINVDDARGRRAEYTDVRDDRVMQFFSLHSGESIEFRTRVNAAYSGRYYLPSVSVEAMYDATRYARTEGRWTEVVSAGR